MRHVKPCRGWCLVEMLAPESVSAGGVNIPESAIQPAQTEQGRDKTISPRGTPIRGIVVEIGPWPVVEKGPKKGFQKPPDFRLGDTVVVPPKAGIPFRWAHGRPLKLVHQEDVLALVSFDT